MDAIDWTGLLEAAKQVDGLSWYGVTALLIVLVVQFVVKPLYWRLMLGLTAIGGYNAYRRIRKGARAAGTLALLVLLLGLPLACAHRVPLHNWSLPRQCAPAPSEALEAVVDALLRIDWQAALLDAAKQHSQEAVVCALKEYREQLLAQGKRQLDSVQQRVLARCDTVLETLETE